jgi:hypothetical protein
MSVAVSRNPAALRAARRGGGQRMDRTRLVAVAVARVACRGGGRGDGDVLPVDEGVSERLQVGDADVVAEGAILCWTAFGQVNAQVHRASIAVPSVTPQPRSTWHAGPA